MKKLLLIVAVITAFSFVSCKKDRTCTCTHTPVSGAAETFTVTYFDSHKKNAQLGCEMEATEYDDVTPVAQKGGKTTCTLK